MTIPDQIEAYIAAQPGPKQGELRTIHRLILNIAPEARLWFLNGRDETGKIVSNPNIGYGAYEIVYAGGKTREFYRIGLSANTTGISVYVMGIADKKYLAETFGKALGKASVSGYCIKFRRLGDIDLDILAAAIRFGLSR